MTNLLPSIKPTLRILFFLCMQISQKRVCRRPLLGHQGRTQKHECAHASICPPSSLRFDLNVFAQGLSRRGISAESGGEVFRRDSGPLCQGAPFGQCCSPSHLTPYNKAYPLIWIGYLDKAARSTGAAASFLSSGQRRRRPCGKERRGLRRRIPQFYLGGFCKYCGN